MASDGADGLDVLMGLAVGGVALVATAFVALPILAHIPRAERGLGAQDGYSFSASVYLDYADASVVLPNGEEADGSFINANTGKNLGSSPDVDGIIDTAIAISYDGHLSPLTFTTSVNNDGQYVIKSGSVLDTPIGVHLNDDPTLSSADNLSGLGRSL